MRAGGPDNRRYPEILPRGCYCHITPQGWDCPGGEDGNVLRVTSSKVIVKLRLLLKLSVDKIAIASLYVPPPPTLIYFCLSRLCII